MFFETSKLVWFVAEPTNALLILLVVASVLRWMGFRRTGRFVAAASTLLLLLVAFSPVGNLLLRPLEDRFPAPSADLAPPTGIIVLGGSTDEVVTEARHQVKLTTAASRVTEAVVLSRRYPGARLVFSGGSGNLMLHLVTEADITRRLWIDLGVSPERITIENRSRNTDENARFTKAIVDPKPDERWLLVTSALHMPRAMGVFRAAGFPVIPYPVDYLTTDGDSDLLPRPQATDGLYRFDLAAKEWVGLAVYNLTGRTQALFPAP